VKHKSKQEGDGAAGGQIRNTDEMIPYDGEKSASVSSYNFCFLCKDRLEVIHDDFDEGWYFVNAKQIRVKPTDAQ